MFSLLDKTSKVSFFTTVSIQVDLLSTMSSDSADMMVSWSSVVRPPALSKLMVTEPSSRPIFPPGRKTTRLPTTLGASMRVWVSVEDFEKIALGSGLLSSAVVQVDMASTAGRPAATLAALTWSMISVSEVW